VDPHLGSCLARNLVVMVSIDWESAGVLFLGRWDCSLWWIAMELRSSGRSSYDKCRILYSMMTYERLDSVLSKCLSLAKNVVRCSFVRRMRLTPVPYSYAYVVSPRCRSYFRRTLSGRTLTAHSRRLCKTPLTPVEATRS
jgi:hypothetical protein